MAVLDSTRNATSIQDKIDRDETQSTIKSEGGETPLGYKTGDSATQPAFDAREFESHETDAVSSITTSTAPKQVEESVIEARVNVAKTLVDTTNKLVSTHGKPEMPAHVRLLRRALADAHKALRQHSCEANYVTVIVAVETALQNIDWKSVSKAQLKQLASALASGLGRQPISFQASQRQARLFRNFGLRSLPSFDVDED